MSLWLEEYTYNWGRDSESWQYIFKHILYSSMQCGSCQSMSGWMLRCVSQTVLLADAFFLRKITTNPHIFAQVNTGVRKTGIQNEKFISQN